MDRKLRLSTYVLWVFLAVTFILSALVALRADVNFDEAINLQVPVSLATAGEYRTHYQYARRFDPKITSGPTILLPIAGIFRLFGIGLVQSRVISWFYFMLMIWGLVTITIRLANTWAAVVAALLVILLPELFFFGLRTLGEIPALFFFLISVITLGMNKPGLTGVSLGLMTLTKLIFGIAALPLLIAGIASLWLLPFRKRVLIFFGRMAMGWVAVFAVWELYRWKILGWSGYIENISDHFGYFQAATSSTQAVLTILKAHVKAFATPFGTGKVVALAAIGTCIIILLYSLWYFSRGGITQVLTSLVEWRGSYELTESGELEWTRKIMGLYLTGFASTYLIWWLTSKVSAWWRYLLPFYIVLILLFSCALVNGFRVAFGANSPFKLLKQAIWVLGMLIASLAVIRLATLQMTNPFPDIYSTNLPQQDIAAEIREQSDKGAFYTYWGWYQAPELSFLSGVMFYDLSSAQTRDWLNKKYMAGHPIYVIVSDVQKSFAPETLEVERQFMGPQVTRKAGFDIFLYRPRYPYWLPTHYK